MGFRLPSYQSARCCRNTHCPHDSEEEPCWGEVDVRGEDSWGEDWYWIHACEGHAGLWEGEPYKPSDRPEDQGALPVEDDE